MKDLDHYNITKYIDSFISGGNHYCLIMEYARGKNLRNMMSIYATIKQGSFPEDLSMNIFSQLVIGMIYLHSKNIMHRDLKPENILADAGGRILLCDFGFSKKLSSFSAQAKTLAGSYPYMPPEMLKGEIYDNSADVWAAGLILYELLTGVDTPKFNGESRAEVLEQLKNLELTFPKHTSEPAQNLVLKILNDRPSFSKLAEEPVLKIYIDHAQKLGQQIT